MQPSTEDEQYPMRGKYWCCAERIGGQHKPQCPRLGQRESGQGEESKK